jgi:hypothetical protein
MKKRTGFVSNSSSSSFIISKEYNPEEIKAFVRKNLIAKTEKKIKEVESKGDDNVYSNWKEYIEMLKEDISDENLDYNINVCTVKEFSDEWDLTEWYDLTEIPEDDLVLYDNDDNVINWISDEIIEKYNVKEYCLHMG